MTRAEADEIVLGIGDARFPSALRHVHDPPERLHVRGALAATPAALALPAVAVVGSRDATAYGLGIATDLARGLAAAGIVVVSGLALGIDGAAHRAALEAGGTTVAVVGSGTDVLYPRQHRALRAAILERGAIVSEHPPETPARRGHFPRRNRIISGLCLGVVVVEAAVHSGSLSTAQHALEQGREVFAVPGPVGAPRSRGPHSLLRRGARLVETIDDILAELPPGIAVPRPLSRAGHLELPPELGAVVDGIRAGAVTVDALAQRSGAKVANILENLLALELRGLVLRGPGGRFALSGAAMAPGTARARDGVDSPVGDR